MAMVTRLVINKKFLTTTLLALSPSAPPSLAGSSERAQLADRGEALAPGGCLGAARVAALLFLLPHSLPRLLDPLAQLQQERSRTMF